MSRNGRGKRLVLPGQGAQLGPMDYMKAELQQLQQAIQGERNTRITVQRLLAGLLHKLGDQSVILEDSLIKEVVEKTGDQLKLDRVNLDPLEEGGPDRPAVRVSLALKEKPDDGGDVLDKGQDDGLQGDPE